MFGIHMNRNTVRSHPGYKSSEHLEVSNKYDTVFCLETNLKKNFGQPEEETNLYIKC